MKEYRYFLYGGCIFRVTSNMSNITYKSITSNTNLLTWNIWNNYIDSAWMMNQVLKDCNEISEEEAFLELI